MTAQKDPEANREHDVAINTTTDMGDENIRSTSESGNRITSSLSKWYKLLLEAGVEENGIRPVPPEGRTEKQLSNLFTVFFTCLLCILPLVAEAVENITGADNEKVAHWSPRHGRIRPGSARCFVDHHLLQYCDMPTPGLHQSRRIQNGNATDDTSQVLVWVSLEPGICSESATDAACVRLSQVISRCHTTPS